MTRLYILGPAEIRNEEGELEHSFLAGPKRLALLSYLLLSRPRGFHRRDSLLPLFWPHQNQKSARNALSNMLYHIRQTLGKDAIENRGTEEVTLNPRVFWCDALTFEEGMKKKDRQKALSLYRSELLKGFHADTSTEFDHWLEQERNRFHSLAVDGNRLMAQKAYDAQELQLAITHARKAAELDPFSEALHYKLIYFLNEFGDTHTALETYNSFSRLLLEEFEEAPGAELQNLAETIKKRKASSQDYTSSIPLTKRESHPSIAVLPFETLGKERASAFTDAIHGDILTRLSQASDLFVISRTSVRNFRGKGKLLPEIARELQVDWLLTGEIQETESQVKLNVRLVNAASDRQVWAETYQKRLNAENLFQIQDEITGDILETLKVKVSGKAKIRMTGNPTGNLDAYRLYARGRNCLDRRTEPAIYEGLDCFQNSIELDPEYALAWSGLADALCLLEYYGFAVPKHSPDPIEAAKRAVSLNPELGEAHASLGIAYSIRQQGADAFKELELAVKLTPGYAEALIWLGWVNLILGRPEQAIKPATQAIRLNPLAPAFRIFLAEIYLANGLFDKALKEAGRGREINPEYGLAHYVEGLALYHNGQMEEAATAFKKTLSLISSRGTPTKTEVKTALAFTRHALGDSECGLELKDRIHRSIDPFSLGLLQTLYGKTDEAFQTFLRVTDWTSFSTETIRYFFPQLLIPLRQDKRYRDLMQRVDSAWGKAE